MDSLPGGPHVIFNERPVKTASKQSLRENLPVRAGLRHF